MANLVVFLACTLAVLLFVGTSRAAVADTTCGSAEADQVECKKIVNAECDTSGLPVCKCKNGTTEDAATSTCPLGLDKDCTDLTCTTEHSQCSTDTTKCECKSEYEPNVEKTACVQKESGAASTKAMIWMMFSVLLIRLVDKLLM